MNNQDAMDRYEEALAKARQAIKDCGDNEGRKQMIYGIFPELAESEDKKCRKEIRDLLVNCCEADRRFPHLLAWLEKQKEQQQPTEWSEEDNKCYEFIVNCLRGCANGEKLAFPRSTALKYIDWFQSIRFRPHWKPSEEQMKMLLAIVNDPNNAGAESCHLAMQSLYNDLKKLM